jgi:glycosyltransferase involved in cell wall biosynthesis
MFTNIDTSALGSTFSVSIIIVVKNNLLGLRKTLCSLADQTLQQFNVIIVDGQSNDGTLNCVPDFIDTFQSLKVISEPDRNVYHAMNKAINISNDQFLIFLNSGDIFFDEKTFLNIKYIITSDHLVHDVYYGDSIIRFPSYDEFREGNILLNRFIHQSMIYKKSLHLSYGNYIDSHPITISDYIFFKNLSSSSFKKINKIISINESGGISDSLKSFRQYIFFNYLYGHISFLHMLCIFAIHPFYRFLKRLVSNKH